jgi:hypothetical protein
VRQIEPDLLLIEPQLPRIERHEAVRQGFCCHAAQLRQLVEQQRGGEGIERVTLNLFFSGRSVIVPLFRLKLFLKIKGDLP